MKHEFVIFADYFHFYVEDDGRYFGKVIENLWDEQSLQDMVAIRPGLIAVATARNMPVPVTIEIEEDETSKIESSEWDHIVERTIEISSGRIVVLGTTDFYPSVARIEVKPNIYRVTIYYSDLNTLSEDGLDGNDSYKLVFQPSSQIKSNAT